MLDSPVSPPAAAPANDPPSVSADPATPLRPAAAIASSAAAALLAGCGDGTSTSPAGWLGQDEDLAAADDDPGPGASRATKDAGGSTGLPTVEEAARFLGQATPGVRWGHVVSLSRNGFETWLRRQFAMPRGERLWDWMIARGYGTEENRLVQAGVDRALWCQLITAPDLLRQRVALALSEILVVNPAQMAGLPWKALAGAAYYDLLLDHAFGNFRDLLGAVSRNVGMGAYLTFLDNRRADPATGAVPDENYARELMQLFTIGLYALSPGGHVRQRGGVPIETYTQDDIVGLARVFTGWRADGRSPGKPDWLRAPMVNLADRHEAGEKTFLGKTIPAGTDGPTSLDMALDHLFRHPNVGPFICRQLIQRLVTSNPGGGYVRRVAAVFDDNGQGVRGDLKAVIRAILLDESARRPRGPRSRFGKLREPMLRVTAWARAFRATTVEDRWMVDMSRPDVHIGQSPLRSPTVFNFFRPGFAFDDGDEDTNGTVLPEFELVHETSAVGWLNFVAKLAQNRVQTPWSHLVGDYAMLGRLPDDAAVLVDRLNLVIAGGQLSAAVRATIADAVATMPSGTPEARVQRTMAALTLLMSAPQYLHQK